MGLVDELVGQLGVLLGNLSFPLGSAVQVAAPGFPVIVCSGTRYRLSVELGCLAVVLVG
jgi:hypothetical protein